MCIINFYLLTYLLIVGVRKLEWYQNVCSASFSFVIIHVSDRMTDRQTDGRTELR